MSEVVPLPSFGEVFFDARGQERCLRVTWHEGTLVLSLWRGEMCTASFRMPMEDVGRLLDTLDEGFAEATGEQPAVPAHDPGTEVMPGTGQYQRPAPPVHQQPPLDERPVSLSPNDVLVARGPAPQDKLVAGFGESAGSREQTPAYGERAPFTGPQYVDSTGPQPRYTGDPYSGPQYTGDPASGPHYSGDPASGPQYTGDPFSGPQYTADRSPYQQPQQQPDRFTGSQYAEPQYAENEPLYQMPGADQRRSAPLSTDPLGFPSQAAGTYAGSGQQAQPYQADPYAADSYGSDSYGSDSYGRRDSYAQPSQQQPQPQQQSQGGSAAAGLGTPMHGIPGAGRRRTAPQQPAAADYGADYSADYRDDYGSYQQPQQQPNPVDPLLALGRQEQYPQQSDPGMTRPYVGDPMFSTGERLRPDQPDYHERSDRRDW
ncbi:hypothetical protein [Nonomuraea wenchangensis]|uniref:hypothetical protein n=1 Tax=Nonomuraea wenchangensis TaxID=568860 RepID=UPI0033FB2CA1